MKRRSRSRVPALMTHGRRRRLAAGVESLEGRAVMSVCGVTCALVDGNLTVDGTEGDDLIALRYDADASLVSVVGANEELVGQFRLDEISRLNVNGRDGNDLISVDPSLNVAMSLHGGEGEDALHGAVASSAGHQHGAARPPAVQQASIERTVTQLNLSASLPELEENGAEEVERTSLFGSPTASIETAIAGTASSIAAVTAVQGHALHGETSATLFLTLVHGHESHSSASIAAAMVQVPGHGHVGSEGIQLSVSHAPELATESSGTEIGNHDKHEPTFASGEASSKLVPKPCTVRPTGGLIITSADGKRQCNCPEKQAAAEQATEQIFAQEGAQSGVAGLLAAATGCVPCQASLFAALPGEMLTCSLPAMPSPSTLVLDHLSGEACPEKRAAADELAAEESGWLGGLQLAGWSLVAASVALSPTLLVRKKSAEEDEQAPVAADWLFGRLNVELLMAR